MDPARFLALDTNVAGGLTGPQIDNQWLGCACRKRCDQGKKE
jgi:hypothetical protein